MRMNYNSASKLVFLVACGVASSMTPAGADESTSHPIYSNAPYAALLGVYQTSIEKDDNFDNAPGAALLGGVRRDGYALEIGADYLKGKGAQELGGEVNGLFFPFASTPGLYGLGGVGLVNVKDYPGITGNRYGKDFNVHFGQAGVGYLFPVAGFGIRAEALFRYGRYDGRVLDQRPQVTPVEAEVPNTFKDVLLRVGLQYSFGKVVPPPPVEPTAVVPPVAICADGQDNDADGAVDFPADPGCSAADDGDETDPPLCSNGKDDDGDGLIDFPSDKGCTAADDNDEVDPCKTPEPGERISLKGCGTGDIIVLRGVNFEFDKARLTANAKTILDNVSEELTAYPEIKVELSGHTDAKGSDEYNQNLSEKRAASVKAYLKSKGVAADRMTSVGYGESKPVADNETDEGRELNRRVELKVTAGVAPGGPSVVSEAASPEAPAADAAAVDPASTDGALPEAAATP